MQVDKQTIIVVFGGTGDLMQNKIAPSLYYLLSKSDSKNTKILGCGRSQYSDETYKSFLKVGIDKKLNIDAEENILANFNYLQGDLNETIFYENLNDYLQSEKLKSNELNVVIYFSVMPELFSHNSKVKRLGKNRESKIDH